MNFSKECSHHVISVRAKIAVLVDVTDGEAVRYASSMYCDSTAIGSTFGPRTSSLSAMEVGNRLLLVVEGSHPVRGWIDTAELAPKARAWRHGRSARHFEIVTSALPNNHRSAKPSHIDFSCCSSIYSSPDENDFPSLWPCKSRQGKYRSVGACIALVTQ